MKRYVFAALAAGFLTFPAAAAEAPSTGAERIQLSQSSTDRIQMAQVNVRIGSDRGGVRVGPRRNRVVVRERARCRTVVIKERRGNTMVTRRIKRC